MDNCVRKHKNKKYTISLTDNASPVFNSAIKVHKKIMNCNFFRLWYYSFGGHLQL